jgi:hypothetical protein
MDAAPRRWEYERSDASPRLIAALAAGIAATLLAVPALLMLVYPGAVHRGTAAAAGTPLPPAPRLQVDPAADLAALRAAESARLASYAWIDREHGIARIPIARAMALLATRGLPGWPGERTPASASPLPGTGRR